MMSADWLGLYADGGDSWEGGSRTIRFSQAADGTIRFHYAFRAESNHGYDVAEHDGTVVSVDAAAITVELAASSSSSWEDMFKEHLAHEDTSRRRVTIEVVRIEQGRPVLQYAGAAFAFVRGLS